MKTRNNVQKAISKSLAVIISLVLISLTVNAQDFWRTVMENNSFSQIAMVMVDNTEVSTASVDAYSASDMDNFTKYTAVETEEALNIEEWMVNENNFFTTLNIETEVEEALEVESWMTNENLFDGMAKYFEVETESNLEVEDWMKDTNYFGVVTVDAKEDSDEALELEAWMTNSKIWKI